VAINLIKDLTEENVEIDEILTHLIEAQISPLISNEKFIKFVKTIFEKGVSSSSAIQTVLIDFCKLFSTKLDFKMQTYRKAFAPIVEAELASENDPKAAEIFAQFVVELSNNFLIRKSQLIQLWREYLEKSFESYNYLKGLIILISNASDETLNCEGKLTTENLKFIRNEFKNLMEDLCDENKSDWQENGEKLKEISRKLGIEWSEESVEETKKLFRMYLKSLSSENLNFVAMKVVQKFDRKYSRFLYILWAFLLENSGKISSLAKLCAVINDKIGEKFLKAFNNFFIARNEAFVKIFNQPQERISDSTRTKTKIVFQFVFECHDLQLIKDDNFNRWISDEKLLKLMQV
jgi:hypothetical protein